MNTYTLTQETQALTREGDREREKIAKEAIKNEETWRKQACYRPQLVHPTPPFNRQERKIWRGFYNWQERQKKLNSEFEVKTTNKKIASFTFAEPLVDRRKYISMTLDNRIEKYFGLSLPLLPKYNIDIKKLI